MEIVQSHAYPKCKIYNRWYRCSDKTSAKTPQPSGYIHPHGCNQALPGAWPHYQVWRNRLSFSSETAFTAQSYKKIDMVSVTDRWIKRPSNPKIWLKTASYDIKSGCHRAFFDDTLPISLYLLSKAVQPTPLILPPMTANITLESAPRSLKQAIFYRDVKNLFRSPL